MSATTSILTQALLDRCRERAPQYDRDNKFCQEDFDELKAAGYLRMAIPKEFGGPGHDARAGVARNAAARAVRARHRAVHQHAQLLGRRRGRPLARGDKSCEWILRDAAAGEVFAAGHAEHGNDIPGLLSTTKAERVDGGYTFTGRKSFGSLTPVWTRLGMHGMDTSDPARRRSSTRSCRATRRATRSRTPGT